MGWFEVDRRTPVALLLALAACTDPTFRDEIQEAGAPALADGGVPPAAGDAAQPAENTDERDAATAREDAAAHDASSPASRDAATAPDAALDAPDAGGPSAAIPAWARPLLGRYYKRSILVGYDEQIPPSGMTTASIELSLVTIGDGAAGELEMSIETCSMTTQWYSQTAKLAVEDVSRLTPTKLRLVLGEAPHFASETSFQNIGFDPSRAARCEAGVTRAPKFPEQDWIIGTSCTCPMTPEILPQTSSDCRLTDPDEDGRPGLKFTGTGLATDAAMVMNMSLKITEGEVRADREHVIHEERKINVSCVYAAVDGCYLGNNMPCPGEWTYMLPLAADATCATVLAQSIPLPTLLSGDCR